MSSTRRLLLLGGLVWHVKTPSKVALFTDCETKDWRWRATATFTSSHRIADLTFCVCVRAITLPPHEPRRKKAGDSTDGINRMFLNRKHSEEIRWLGYRAMTTDVSWPLAVIFGAIATCLKDCREATTWPGRTFVTFLATSSSDRVMWKCIIARASTH